MSSEQETVAEKIEIEEAPAQPENAAPEADSAAEEQSDLAQELAEAQAKIKEYWDQIVRLNAEIENNRKRAQRDIENAHKYAVKGFVESLLPVTDSMELGLGATAAENANVDSIKEGMSMTLDMFMQTLEKNGITQVNPVGEKFNPEQHQAMSIQESDEAEPNTVIAVMQKGYLLNDRLIRPAMVIVSKEKSS
jgi:molecular chaperone GrpE